MNLVRIPKFAERFIHSKAAYLETHSFMQLSIIRICYLFSGAASHGIRDPSRECAV